MAYVHESELAAMRQACRRWLSGELSSSDLLLALYAFPDPDALPERHLIGEYIEMIEIHPDWFGSGREWILEDVRRLATRLIESTLRDAPEG